MRIRTPGFAVASAVILSHLVTADAYAQDSRGRAPVIRIDAAQGRSMVSNYIEPSISLSEDAYVFAISMDVDRHIQVLHPADPGISVRMTSRKQLHLPNFFAGYGGSMGGSNRGFASSRYDYYDPGFSDTRGTIIALASRKPFNLDAVTIDGQWDLEGVRLLVDGRDPSSAAAMLARYLGAKGEPIGRDVHRFAGAPRHYRSSFYECHPVYGALGYGSYGRGVSRFRAAALEQAGYRVRYIGIDGCGEPRFMVIEGPNPSPIPGGRPPAAGAFPRSRVPVARVPRNPAREKAMVERTTGARPQAGDRYRERDVNTAPARARTANPRAADRPRPQPVGSSERARNPAAAQRPPAEARPAPRIRERQPVFRPDPQVTRERMPPPQPRAVERPRHEKPQPVEAKPVDQ